tara:strand:- start:64544 stop:64969 length:426 start_codon:yes stop_codon:yes gene_type:complete
MEMDKIGHFYKKALLVEDSEDICDFYKDFFEMEELPLDVFMSIPDDSLEISGKYDLLICDWFVGPQSAEKWLKRLDQKKQLPQATIIATGMPDIEDNVSNLPIHLIYKPFDFYSLKDLLINFKQNQAHPTLSVPGLPQINL